jgi:cell division protein FtsA
LFQLLIQRLPQDACANLKAGVFLTGGTSLMSGISALAYETFRCPIYHPQIPELTGIQAGYRDPRYATPVGLIRYAQILDAERTPKRGFFGRVCRAFWPFGN